jgi:hypothetical protein
MAMKILSLRLWGIPLKVWFGFVGLCATIPLIVSCSLFGNNAAPPTAFEQSLFDVTTNFVARVQTNQVYVTNSVMIPIVQTNIVMQTVTITNTVGLVVPTMNPIFQYQTVWQTNQIVATNTVTATNWVPQFTYVPNAAATNYAGIAGTLSNFGLPGVGSLVSMGVIGALGIWGKLRGNKVAGALAQGIETARTVIQTTPQGQQLDANFKAWLVAHQSAAGVINAVTGIVNSQINTPTGEAIAQSGANQITAGLPAIVAVTTAAPGTPTGPTITTAVAPPKV